MMKDKQLGLFLKDWSKVCQIFGSIEFLFWNENSAKDDVELPYSILVLHVAATALPEPHDI